MIRTQGIKLSEWQAFTYYAASMFCGIVTPGRVGEAIKIFYLTENGITSGRATLSVVLDRLFDVFFLILCSLAGIMVILNFFSWSVFVGLTICAVLLFVILFWKKIAILQTIKKSIFVLIPGKYKERVNVFFKEAESDLPLFSLWKVFGISVFSVLSLICYVIPLYILGRGIYLQASPPVLILAILLSSAISMLPISVGGIGTRDGFLILYLGQAGVSKEVALLFSFMFV
jgi:uncharacterized protein (TIRG00374 family)